MIRHLHGGTEVGSTVEDDAMVEETKSAENNSEKISLYRSGTKEDQLTNHYSKLPGPKIKVPKRK